MEGALGKITLSTIRADAHRFSKLHSWYKNIAWPAETFFVTFGKGQEPRNGIRPEISDAIGTHLCMEPAYKWQPQKNWFGNPTELPPPLPQVVQDNPVLLTPLLRGDDGVPGRPRVQNTPLHQDRPRYLAFLASKGIDVSDADDYCRNDDFRTQEALFYERERLRMIDDIVAKASIIARSMGILEE